MSDEPGPRLIDTCCGGELPLAVAADHHGVALERLLNALENAAPDPGRGDG